MRCSQPVFPFRVRSDGWGDGHFGAPRGGRCHDGVDAEIVIPKQIIVAPFAGLVEKVDYPYGYDLRWKGIQISNDLVRCEIWYMSPKENLVGHTVRRKQILGFAQDISEKYPPNQENGYMHPHVHIRMSLKSNTYLVNGDYSSDNIFVDPLIFFELSQT